MSAQLNHQISGIYQDYLQSSLRPTHSYEEYIELFYQQHPNSHLSYSKTVKNALRPNMKLDKMRARLRQKLEQRRLKQMEATP